jgi:hypothetical protein
MALRQIAGYIQSLGLLSESQVLSSGFDIIIPNTVAGTTYSVRIQAIGGSTQYSPWSAVISLMST